MIKRWRGDKPVVNNLRSSCEWSGSSIVTASGSPKTVDASSNEIPCLIRFFCAFSGCHSNCTLPAYHAEGADSRGLPAGSHGQRFSDRGLFSCPMLQRQAVNRDGTRRYRCPVQSKFAVTRPPPEEPTVRTALTVATPASPAACARDSTIPACYAFVIKGRTHGQKNADRGYPLGAGDFPKGQREQ